MFSSYRHHRAVTSIRTRLLPPFLHWNSSFYRYFPECAQMRSFATSCSDPVAIGQVSLTRRGSALCRCRPHIRASIRRAIEVGGQAKGGINFIVRCFLSPKCLALRQNFSPEMPQPQYLGTGPSEQAPPHHYQAQQHYVGSPSFHPPVQPPAPEQKPAHSFPQIFHYSKCTGKKKAVCVRIFSYHCAKLDADECHIRLGRDQLCRDSQGIEWLCE